MEKNRIKPNETIHDFGTAQQKKLLDVSFGYAGLFSEK